MTQDVRATSNDSEESAQVVDIFWVLEKLGLLGIPVVIGIYWIQQRANSRQRMRAACDAMASEIADHKDGFQYGYKQIVRDLDTKFTIVYFNTDAYESILHSGMFTDFSKETQVTLANLYLRIRQHNDHITYRSRLKDSITTAQRDNLLRPYEELLSRWEVGIHEHLSNAEILVSKERPRHWYQLKHIVNTENTG